MGIHREGAVRNFRNIKYSIMKLDKFTKVLLTVIAVNLTFITVKSLDLVPGVYAHDLSDEPAHIPDVRYGLVPVNEDGSINVRLISAGEIDVNIVDISTYDKLSVHLESAERYLLRYAGPLDVRVK